jgi:HAD superfamily hydrolase (TIGR01509 family)
MNDINALIAPPQPFSALIFDCDGTLADTLPNHFRSWILALRLFGADFDEDHFYSMSGMTTNATIEALNEEFGYGLDVRQTHDEKENRYKEMIASVREIKAVADVVRAYHGRVPLAVATGATRDVVEATLAATGLRSYFSVVVTADDVVNGKPAPDTYLLAAERLGVAPSECVVYEDAEMGLESARRAGMRLIDVRVLWQGRRCPTPLEPMLKAT